MARRQQAADRDVIAEMLSDDPGVLAIGTDAEEWYAGPRAFADAHMSGGPFTATVDHVEAHREGRVAWAALPGGGAGLHRAARRHASGGWNGADGGRSSWCGVGGAAAGR